MKLKLIHFPLLLVVAFVAYLAFPWLLIFIGIQSKPNPPRPEITYGEFPFRLKYEINGNQKVIEDTLICEFDGFGADEGRGKYRKWKRKLASGNERITLLKVDSATEIYFTAGRTEYYMGDPYYANSNSSFPNASVVKKEGAMSKDSFLKADELLKQYNIRLISWDVSPPIKNNFNQLVFQ
ncbi:hypothetical protein [Paenibacillus sp. P36]|uniref:hypothetical protein n=1 Tax=Paenibacillus sp. P36 TaxID=3342538 RepID=UPI0038B25361